MIACARTRWWRCWSAKRIPPGSPDPARATRASRVIVKAKHLAKGENPRFVATSRAADQSDPRTLYDDNDDPYCAGGDKGNRIKEQQLGLFADRSSGKPCAHRPRQHLQTS
jgi:hypothetical protein